MIRTFKKPAIPTQKLPVDGIEVRESGLLIPGKKPVGLVKVNNSHPLRPDFAVIPGITGRYDDLITGNSSTFGSGNDIRVSQGVKVLHTNDTAQTGQLAFPGSVGTGNFTTMGRVKASTVEGVHCVCASGDYNPGWLYLEQASGDGWGMYLGGVKDALTSGLSANVFHNLCIVREGTGASQLKFYLNGAADGTDLLTNSISATEIQFGGSADAFLAASDIEYFYFYRRALTDAERLSMTVDPYQFLEPA